MTHAIPDFHAFLDGRLGSRERELRALIDADTDVIRHEHDRNEVSDRKGAADDEAQAVVDDVLASRAAAELDAVTAARRRIADGTYGTCLSCGEPIDERRLLALPAAPLCARCQADLE